MQKQSLYFCFLLLSLGIAGCFSENEIVPDVSHIELDNKLVRFDQLLSALDTNNLETETSMLEGKVPEFYSIFFKNVLPFQTNTKEGFIKNLRGYLSDDRIIRMQDTTAQIFANFEKESLPNIEKGLKLLKHYFPESVTPNLYTFTSEYTYQQFIFPDKGRDGIGIGLDMFLGAKYPYKEIDPNNPAFSNYVTRSFDKSHMAKKVMEILVDDQIGRAPGSRLLDQMINKGKKLYILDKILPEVHDSILLEYTTNQTEWVQSNELQMWAFFFDQNMFYESNAMKINKYINPSPNSPGMPDAAPGRTANYLGWKIVQAYMKRFPETSIQDLIDEKDTQKIMDKSRYKPKRK